MIKYCLCRQSQDAQEIMEKITNPVYGRPVEDDWIDPLSLEITTPTEVRKYEAYECRYCGRLQFFRKLSEKAEQEKLVTA